VTKRFEVNSIHHVTYPNAKEEIINVELEERMQFAQDLCSLILGLRKKENIKVRQPLYKVLIPITGETDVKIKFFEKETILGTNKEVFVLKPEIRKIVSHETNIQVVEAINSDDFDIKLSVKPNYQKIKESLLATTGSFAATGSYAEQIKNWDEQTIKTFNAIGSYTFDKIYTVNKNFEVLVIAEDIPGWSVASKGALTVALDITINEALKMEGDAREFINRIQTIRKESGFELTDKIDITIVDNKTLENSINTYKPYICGEVLANDIAWQTSDLTNGIEIEVNETLLKVLVTKKG
jgi:isoleucyl-tRNA synthetase